VQALTKPTRGRVALWLILSVLWLLFLAQALFPPTNHPKFSVGGAVFWAVVQVGLFWAALTTWRRRRRDANSDG
jgi:uncharacterized membrane protein YhaH (DUF805 family)